MPGPGPDQRDRSRNRRPRRRNPIGGGGRAPVTEFEEQQELEAARERNDLEVNDLREMSVAELKQVSRDLELDTATGERKDVLVDQILQRQTERAGHYTNFAGVVSRFEACFDKPATVADAETLFAEFAVPARVEAS